MNYEHIIGISNTIVDKTHLQKQQQTTLDFPEDIEQMVFSFMLKNDEIARKSKSKHPRPLQHTVLQRAFRQDFRSYINNESKRRVNCWLIDDFFIGLPLNGFVPSTVYEPRSFWYALAHANTILGNHFKVGWLHNDVDAFIRVYVYESGSTTWSKIKKAHADLGFICGEQE